MSLHYILILVDKDTNYNRDIETNNVKVQVISKGQQMCGLRFKHTRPTLIIDEIKDRTYINHNGDDIFEEWWAFCVRPSASKAPIIKA